MPHTHTKLAAGQFQVVLTYPHAAESSIYRTYEWGRFNRSSASIANFLTPWPDVPKLVSLKQCCPGGPYADPHPYIREDQNRYGTGRHCTFCAHMAKWGMRGKSGKGWSLHPVPANPTGLQLAEQETWRRVLDLHKPTTHAIGTTEQLLTTDRYSHLNVGGNGEGYSFLMAGTVNKPCYCIRLIRVREDGLILCRVWNENEDSDKDSFSCAMDIHALNMLFRVDDWNTYPPGPNGQEGTIAIRTYARWDNLCRLPGGMVILVCDWKVTDDNGALYCLDMSYVGDHAPFINRLNERLRRRPLHDCEAWLFE